MTDSGVLIRLIAREKAARREAELILEEKSREIFKANKKLEALAEDLKRQRDKTAAIVEHASEGIVTLDMDGFVKTFNTAACDIFGVPRDTAKGLPFEVFFADTHRQKIRELTETAKTGERDKAELFVDHESGQKRTVDVSIGLTNSGDEDDRFSETIVAVVSDRTRDKMLESQLAHVQKMESVGQLAAGVAHEINTPIQYVGDNASFLKEAFEDIIQLIGLFDQLIDVQSVQEQFPELAKQIENCKEQLDLEFLVGEVPLAITQSITGIGRVAKIVRALREFSHPGTETKVLTDINGCLDSTITVSRNEWKYVADLKTQFDSNLSMVECFPGELNQAFLNLIVNAAHAIEERSHDESGNFVGVITVETHESDDHIQIQISDNGNGISDYALNKVFDPFFTTKGVGKGTGQGLSITHDVIVRKHGGTIEVDTTRGKGTSFKICLPKSEKLTQQEKSPATATI